MPMVSEKQRKWMHANKPAMAKRWEKHTPKGKLPKRKKEAHDLGLLIGICQSDCPLENKMLALHKSAAESPLLTSALAAHAAEWMLQREQEAPGFIKDACAYMEKQAQDPKTAPAPAAAAAPARGSPAALWGLGTSMMGKKPGTMGTMSKIYGFLQKNPWVLPLGMALLGGGLGGGFGGRGGGIGGLLLGGLGGYMAQRYLPQLAQWGAQQFAPEQMRAFSEAQKQRMFAPGAVRTPYETARGITQAGMGQHAIQQIGRGLSAPGQWIQKLQRGLGQVDPGRWIQRLQPGLTPPQTPTTTAAR